MKNRIHQHVIPRLLVLGALLTLLTSACSSESQWKEEVLLSDGKTIVIDRGVMFGPRRAEIGQSSTGAVKYWLSFSNPADGQIVRWENPGKLRPMILAFSGGVPYVVAVPVSAAGYMEAGCPNPAYFFFKYANEWKSIAYQDYPQEARKLNLLAVYSPQSLTRVKRGFISSTEVAKAHQDFSRVSKEVDPNYRGPPDCVLPRYVDPRSIAK